MKKLILALLVLGCVLSFAPVIAQAQTAPGGRTIVYPGERVPGADAVLQPARFTRLALGTWILNALNLTSSGSGMYSNCTVSPGTGLYVTIAPSLANSLCAMYQVAQDDANPLPVGYSPQLAADTTLIAVQALMAGTSNPIGPFTPPGSNSMYYVLEGQIATVDANVQSRTFILSSGSGSYPASTPVPVQRGDQFGAFRIKAGTASASPIKPTVDSGWVAMQYVLVPAGTSQILSKMLSDGSKFAGFAQTNNPGNVLVLNPSPSPSPQSGNAALSGNFAAGGMTLSNLGASYGLCTDASGNITAICTNLTQAFYVIAYGALCNGSNDDSAAIQAAINAAQSAGGGSVRFPAGTCRANGLTVTASNVVLQGAGGAGQAYFNGPLYPIAIPATTFLKYNGGAGGTLLTIANASTIIAGNGATNLGFDGNANAAANGLLIISGSGGTYRNLTFRDFSALNMQLLGTLVGGAGNANGNIVDNVSCTQNGGSNGYCLDLNGEYPGDPGCPPCGNANANTITRVYGTYHNGALVHVGWADGNHITQIQGSASTGGTGSALLLDCYAEANVFNHIHGSVVAIGNSSCVSIPTIGQGSKLNVLENYDFIENTNPEPTVPSDSGASWSDDQGDIYLTPKQNFLGWRGEYGWGGRSNGTPVITTDGGNKLQLGCHGSAQFCTVYFYVNGIGSAALDGIENNGNMWSSNGMAPSGVGNGWAPAILPHGVSSGKAVLRGITGTCTLSVAGTVCTFPNAFFFVDTNFDCMGGVQGSTPTSWSYGTLTTTGFTGYAGAGTPVLSYYCIKF